MFLESFQPGPKRSVSEIVSLDYRTAEVFRRFGLGYCCGGKWPLDIACEMHGIDLDELQDGLKNATQTFKVSSQPDFDQWDIDFLINFIINIHHQYLGKNLPLISELIRDFAAEHINKFPWLGELEEKNELLKEQLLLSVKKEAEILFPYIKQLAHAHKDKEPFAVLLVRTLRKPVDGTIENEFRTTTDILFAIRALTNQYTIPPNVCTSHKVVLSKLRELDNDITQQLFLKHSVLYPRATAIEQEILSMR